MFFGKNTSLLLCTAIAAVISAQTATANPRIPPNLEGRLIALEHRIKLMERSTENVPAATPTGLSGIQIELSRLHEELRHIRGGLEENRYSVDQLQRQLKLANDDIEYRLQALEQSKGPASAFGDDKGSAAFTPAQPVTPSKTPNTNAETKPTHMVQLVFPPQGGYQQTTTTIPAPTSTKEKTIADSAKAIPEGLNFTDPREHYNYAVSLIRQKNFTRARDSFIRFIRLHEDHQLIGNAYYWLGETYYVNNDFVMSADTFRQGFETKPNGIKAADNLYKLAKSLINLDRKSEACIVLEQIQKRYIDKNPEVVGLAFETEKANQCRN